MTGRLRGIGIFCSIFILASSGWAQAPPTEQRALRNLREETRLDMTFQDTDIREVLRLIGEEYDLNVVMSDEVQGKITIELKGISLHGALDAILLARGLDYEIRDNIIWVAPPNVLEAERNQRQAKLELEPLVSEVIVLQYLDAIEVREMVKPMLTARGQITVLERRPFRGFQFGAQAALSGTRGGAGGAAGAGAATTGAPAGPQAGGAQVARSNTLMVVDVQRQVEKIKEIIRQVDIAPRQILIDAKILEVEANSLEDLGIDLDADLTLDAERHPVTLQERANPLDVDINTGSSSTSINENIFGNIFPTSSDAGVRTVFKRLSGEDFTLILHALLQDERTKTLSAPRILTIENQEATILVGEQFPIFSGTVTDQGTFNETLSFFQPVGITLQVVVQVTPQDEITMTIHPAVTSISSLVTGASGLQQPRVKTREADTRVLLKHGETLMIGGLLEDVTKERVFRLPLLGDIPLMGNLFTRRQTDVRQRNLLIFITPSVADLDTAALTESERKSFQSLKEAEDQVFLYDRKKRAKQILREAKKNFKRKNYEVARAQFLRVLSLDSHHSEVDRYLKKIDRALSSPPRPSQ